MLTCDCLTEGWWCWIFEKNRGKFESVRGGLKLIERERESECRRDPDRLNSKQKGRFSQLLCLGAEFSEFHAFEQVHGRGNPSILENGAKQTMNLISNGIVFTARNVQPTLWLQVAVRPSLPCQAGGSRAAHPHLIHTAPRLCLWRLSMGFSDGEYYWY